MCQCAHVCTRCMCKEQNRLQITVFSSSTHSLGFTGFIHLFFYKHFLFIQHSYQFYLHFFLHSFHFSLILSHSFLFPSLFYAFSFLSLFRSTFLHLPSSFSSPRNLRQLSSIIRWMGRRYTPFPTPHLSLVIFVILLLFSIVSFSVALIFIMHVCEHSMVTLCVDVQVGYLRFLRMLTNSPNSCGHVTHFTPQRSLTQMHRPLSNSLI